ncbi:MAG: hypothetical protein WCC17_02020 [Candidatus Nitrosopolaris sp.]
MSEVCNFDYKDYTHNLTFLSNEDSTFDGAGESTGLFVFHLAIETIENQIKNER